jgi:redox-sensitive bicupin YhaK (pirin superfamily)
MKSIEVEKIIEPVAASDGAGVKLKRSIGTHLIDYHDPFLMLDEFGSENKDDYIGGFPPHPHRGIETVTYMLAGDFEHKDSTGGEGIMTAGDVQWMKTGSGIIHSEMTKPEYIYIDADKMSTHKDDDKTVKVIAGKFQDAEGPVKGHNVEPVYFDVELEKGKKFNFDLPSTHNSLIYLVEGEIKVGDQDHDAVKDSTLIILTRGEKLKVSSLTKAKFLLISGKPIGEPIARGGPFVMNTKAEILQAVQDYHNDTFVK